ncbi:hypothetical protein Dimus_000590, partial [Dionaea muscipula]
MEVTIDVVAVGGDKIPIEGTVGGTQESEVVVSKGKTKPKSQPKKKDIISPAVGENEVEVETGDSEETQSDEDTQTERPAAVPDVSKEGQRKKRRQ